MLRYFQLFTSQQMIKNMRNRFAGRSSHRNILGHLVILKGPKNLFMVCSLLGSKRMIIMGNIPLTSPPVIVLEVSLCGSLFPYFENIEAINPTPTIEPNASVAIFLFIFLKRGKRIENKKDEEKNI